MQYNMPSILFLICIQMALIMNKSQVTRLDGIVENRLASVKNDKRQSTICYHSSKTISVSIYVTQQINYSVVSNVRTLQSFLKHLQVFVSFSFFASDNNKIPYFSYVDARTCRFHSLPVDEWVEVSGFQSRFVFCNTLVLWALHKHIRLIAEKLENIKKSSVINNEKHKEHGSAEKTFNNQYLVYRLKRS